MPILQGKWRFNEVLVIDADLAQNVNFTSTTIFEDGSTRSMTCSAVYVVKTTDGATGHVDYTIESVVPDDGETYPKTTEVYMDSVLGWGTALVGGKVQIVADFGSTPQEVSDEFYAWFTANAIKEKTPVVAISYKGGTLVSLFGGEAVTLNTKGTQLEEGIRIEAFSGGDSGACSGDHIIEVAELPTENIDKNAVYFCDGAFCKGGIPYKEFSDLLMVDSGRTQSLKASAYTAGVAFSINMIPTRTTEGVMESDTTSGPYNAYYIEDEDRAFFYVSGDWLVVSEAFDTTYNGTVGDASEVTADGMYALVKSGTKWEVYSTGKMVVEVVELPTDNINESAVYLCDGNYYIWVSEISDIVMALGDWGTISMTELAAAEGITFSVIMVNELPTENILESTDSCQYFYYLVDSNVITSYQNGQWQEPQSITAVVTDITEIPTGASGYYLVGGTGWKEYIHPIGALGITESGSYDVYSKKTVHVNIPDAAICGIYTLNETIDRCPSQEVNFKYTNDSGVLMNGISMGSTGLDGELYYNTSSGSDMAYNPCYYPDCWYSENYRTIDFGTDPQLVSSKFKEWLIANAAVREIVVSEEILSVTPSSAQQVFNTDVFYKNVVVQAVPTETLTVSAGGTTKTYTPTEGKYFSQVTVNKADTSDLSSLRIPYGMYFKSFPKTEYAIGDWLSVKDGVLCVQYTDGTTEDVSLTYSMVSDFSTSKTGKYMLTVSCSLDGRIYRTTYQYTVSDGPVSFTIDYVTYYADEGMTWEEWCASSYNTDGWTISNSNITKDGTTFVTFNELVNATDTIKPWAAYNTRS